MGEQRVTEAPGIFIRPSNSVVIECEWNNDREALVRQFDELKCESWDRV
jgi:hypothetical protein